MAKHLHWKCKVVLFSSCSSLMTWTLTFPEAATFAWSYTHKYKQSSEAFSGRVVWVPITPNYSVNECIWDTQMYLQCEVIHVSLKQHEQGTYTTNYFQRWGSVTTGDTTFVWLSARRPEFASSFKPGDTNHLYRSFPEPYHLILCAKTQTKRLQCFVSVTAPN